MNRSLSSLTAIVLAGVFLLAVGCAALRPQVDTTRFFVLTPLSEMGAGVETQPALEGLALGLGPVELPEYLDRPQMVRRRGSHQVEVSENDRWAEPLEVGFTRVLGKNLVNLLGLQSVVGYPWPVTQELDYQVQVDVLRFEATEEGAAELAARWWVKDGETKRVLLARDVHVKRPAASATGDASVAALSEALGEISRDIASSIRGLHTRR